jgi:hypothetical protein
MVAAGLHPMWFIPNPEGEMGKGWLPFALLIDNRRLV